MKIKKIILICSFLSILAGPSAFANDVSCEDFTNPDGYTALMKASANGEIERVRCLINANKDDLKYINAKELEHGATALIYAAFSGREIVAEVLIKNGADVNAVNGEVVGLPQGWTPLMFAAKMGHIDVVEVLIKNGADVHAENGEGERALEIAAIWGMDERRMALGDLSFRQRRLDIIELLKEEEAKKK